MITTIKNMKLKIMKRIIHLSLIILLFIFSWNLLAKDEDKKMCPANFLDSYVNTHYLEVATKTSKMLEELRPFLCKNTEVFFTKAELIKLLDGGHYAITCAFPRSPGKVKMLSRQEVSKMEGIMQRYLNCRGLNFVRAHGYYDGVEIPNTYIIINADDEEMKALAGSFAQFSLILADKGKAKMLYFQGENKGKFYLGNSWLSTPKASDNYTAVNTKDNGLIKFTINFDFNQLHQDKDSF